ncbi:hypothetical protein ACOSQ2_005406 [Xanthoceras sorbifolium]|uniref:F-box domain-containing protein n=1 Tax=Xanthoceras sorbifolium TaxID=99658 RepID=A0ABQ8IF92_9ROSI|nr:hypothetical protein JRO89_XS02G0088100 [Xanthoceras sorbifolium]
MSDYIPQEVLVEIFIRLPAKALLASRLVCKSWCSLITDPKFIYKHTQFTFKSQDTSQLIVRRYYRPDMRDKFTLHRDDESFSEYQPLDIPFDSKYYPYAVVGSCCGLVCLRSTSVRNMNMPQPLVLWNPSAGFCVSLRVRPFIGNILDPIYGFGFDPRTNDYKVVKIVYGVKSLYPNKSPQIVDIFALSEGKWRNITAPAAPLYIINEKLSWVYVNGAIHWIAHYELDQVLYSRKMVVGLFDMSEEVFKELQMPEIIMTERIASEKTQKLSIGDMNHSLSLLHYYTQWENSPSYDGCCIWVMKEYGVVESWTKQFKIDLRLGLGKILGLRRNGEILLVTRYNGELVSFHPETRKINKLGIYGDSWSFNMDFYLESLVLLNGAEGTSRMSSSSVAAAFEKAALHWKSRVGI